MTALLAHGPTPASMRSGSRNLINEAFKLPSILFPKLSEG